MEHLIGKTSWEVIQEVCRQNPQISTLYLVALKEESYRHSEKGSLILMDSRKSLQTDVLANEARWLGRKQNIGGGWFRRDFELLCITSRVLVGNDIWHIPMMDFDIDRDYNPITDRIEQTPQNVEDAKKRLRDYQLPRGVLLDSGRGLHYIGLDLISQAKFEEVTFDYEYSNPRADDGLREAVADSDCEDGVEEEIDDIVDTEWLLECFGDGYFTLRLNNNELVGKPSVPKVVSTFNPPAYEKKLRQATLPGYRVAHLC